MSVGVHVSVSNHQFVRWEFGMEQNQEVKAYGKRPSLI